ncbi:hypothetical protein DPMN_142693 [Dreissena polymorpha]|uniref:Uncharacterized protein n=1 Tax=Dreissena polymorpha TaxID=45954 RepID=A0A9D4GEN9_DREPO|nr:hypothetical protein DPMN_142693 [Dreissena polymorpha]
MKFHDPRQGLNMFKKHGGGYNVRGYDRGYNVGLRGGIMWEGVKYVGKKLGGGGGGSERGYNVGRGIMWGGIMGGEREGGYNREMLKKIEREVRWEGGIMWGTMFKKWAWAKNGSPLGSHVFQANVTIFEIIYDIIENNLLTKFHEDWKINVASKELTRQMLMAHDRRRTTDKKRSQKLTMSMLCSGELINSHF